MALAQYDGIFHEFVGALAIGESQLSGEATLKQRYRTKSWLELADSIAVLLADQGRFGNGSAGDCAP